jgi:hypothetical protein
MAENKNWLSQRGHDINDNDYKALGITEDTIANGNFNREMLDIVHQQNMAGYMKQGMSEKAARAKADKQRSQAIKAAKANGLKM